MARKTSRDVVITIPNPIWEMIQPVLPRRFVPLGSGQWSDRDFFNAILTKFSSKRDWDDLVEFGFPPGNLLYQQFIEWRARGVFAVLSEMDLSCDGMTYHFKIEKIISSELPRHIVRIAIATKVDPETIVQPDLSAYPPDEVAAELETLFPGYAEHSKMVDALVDSHQRRDFERNPDLAINRAKSRSFDKPPRATTPLTRYKK